MEIESVKEMESESGKLMDQQAELCILHEEIMSLVSERKNLLASLTPNLFVWEDESVAAPTPAFNSQQEVREGESALTWLLIPGKVSVQEMASSLAEPAAVSGARPSWQPEKLENYLDSILRDMEDLGHRMLSIADNSTARKLDAPTSLYKTTELFATTSRLVEIVEDLINSNVDNYTSEERVALQEERVESVKQAEYLHDTMGEMAFLSMEKNMGLSNEFSRLCSSYLERPNTYSKHLALIITEEEKKELEEKEMKKELEEKEMKEEEEKMKGKGKGKGKGRKKEKTKNKEEEEEEDYDGVFGEETESKEYLKKRMVLEQGFFSNHRVGWEQIWGTKIGRCGGFHDTTTLSPMHFTHCTPGIIPHGSVVGTTLQIYSFEIKLKADLKWPLCVYGVVAARDTVDRNRNLLFCRSRVNYQLLTRDDPFLCLTGPSRAILALYPVDFEVQLEIIDGDESQDRTLISLNRPYDEDGHDMIALFKSSLCTGKLRLEPINRTVQATIVGVQLVKGSWPFTYGARVACSLLGLASPTREVVLLDTREELTVGADGYLPLARNVVSVALQGGLYVSIHAFTELGGVSGQRGGDLFHRPQHCNISQGKCHVDSSQLEITVAWSGLVQDKMDLLTEGYAAQL